MQPVALWVGDSFTAGEGADVPAAQTYPYLVSARLGWARHVDAQCGTGFVNDGYLASPEYAPLLARLPDDARRYPADIVIVDAGRNDAEVPITVLQQSVTAYLTALRAAYSTARVALIAPTLLDRVQPLEYQYVRTVLRDVAPTCRAVVVDPAGILRDLGRQRHLLSADGFHPSAAGQRFYAEILTPLLERALG